MLGEVRAILLSVTFIASSLLVAESTQERITQPTLEQIAVWQRLYPKLNSKMARMEELLNYIERFLGNYEFKQELLNSSLEFSYLASVSGENLSKDLPFEQRKPFLAAIEETVATANKLYQSIQNSQQKLATQALKRLHKIRKQSHVKWAE